MTTNAINIFSMGYDRDLQKPDDFYNPPSIMESNMNSVNPIIVGSGEMGANVKMMAGYMQSSNFVTGSAGWKIDADGNAEFASGVFRGSITAATIDIGGSDNSSFHVDIDGNAWWGAATFAAAPAKVANSGAATFTSLTLTGYVATGGAAADINANATTVNGGKLTAGTVTADYVVANISISSPTITGGTLRTAASGKRIVIDNTDYVQAYDETGNLVGQFYAETGNVFMAVNSPTSPAFVGCYPGQAYLDCTDISVTLLTDGDTTGALYPDSGTVDLGKSTNKWAALFVSGNITVDGTVDGIDVAGHTHTGGAGGTVAHSSLGSIGANDHHSSTSNGLDITPASVDISGQYLYLYNNTIKADGTAITFNGTSNAHLCPESGLVNSAQVGTSTNYWGKMYANTYYGKSTSITSFDRYDDLSYIRNMRTKTVEGRDIFDVGDLPPEIKDPSGQFVDNSALTGYMLGCIKALAEEVERLKKIK